jgi:hypothetical protein
MATETIPQIEAQCVSYRQYSYAENALYSGDISIRVRAHDNADSFNAGISDFIWVQDNYEPPKENFRKHCAILVSPTMNNLYAAVPYSDITSEVPPEFMEAVVLMNDNKLRDYINSYGEGILVEELQKTLKSPLEAIINREKNMKSMEFA